MMSVSDVAQNDPQVRIIELERQIAALQERVAQSASDIHALTSQLATAQQESVILRTLIDAIPDWVHVVDREYRYRLANQSFAAVLQRDPTDMLGRTANEVGAPDIIIDDELSDTYGIHTADQAVLATGKPVVMQRHLVRIHGIQQIFATLKLPLHNNDGSMWGVLSISRDMTGLEDADAARRENERHEARIQAQEAAIRELLTPLIPVADGVVVMPIVGAVESTRAIQILDTLLAGISQHRAHTAILDITGVKMVDTQVAAALIRAGHAAQLLGTEVILTGISAEVAQTLVSLGAHLGSLKTLASLQRGIAYALRRR